MESRVIALRRVAKCTCCHAWSASSQLRRPHSYDRPTRRTHTSRAARNPVAAGARQGKLWGSRSGVNPSTAGLPPIERRRLLPRKATVTEQTEREGFEPSMDVTAHTGFRDRRIQPLCHLSGWQHKLVQPPRQGARARQSPRAARLGRCPHDAGCCKAATICVRGTTRGRGGQALKALRGTWDAKRRP